MAVQGLLRGQALLRSLLEECFEGVKQIPEQAPERSLKQAPEQPQTALSWVTFRALKPWAGRKE